MDTKTKVNELAKSKKMSLEQFHVWVLNEPYVTKCCVGEKCLGKEMTIDSLTFRVKGHNILFLEAKQDGEEYSSIHTICDH